MKIKERLVELDSLKVHFEFWQGVLADPRLLNIYVDTVKLRSPTSLPGTIHGSSGSSENSGDLEFTLCTELPPETRI